MVHPSTPLSGPDPPYVSFAIKSAWKNFYLWRACLAWQTYPALCLHPLVGCLGKDVLYKHGMSVDLSCVLCGQEEESHNHLFFSCPFSSPIWTSLCAKCNNPTSLILFIGWLTLPRATLFPILWPKQWLPLQFTKFGGKGMSGCYKGIPLTLLVFVMRLYFRLEPNLLPLIGSISHQLIVLLGSFLSPSSWFGWLPSPYSMIVQVFP